MLGRDSGESSLEPLASSFAPCCGVVRLCVSGWGSDWMQWMDWLVVAVDGLVGIWGGLRR